MVISRGLLRPNLAIFRPTASPRRALRGKGQGDDDDDDDAAAAAADDDDDDDDYDHGDDHDDDDGGDARSYNGSPAIGPVLGP